MTLNGIDVSSNQPANITNLVDYDFAIVKSSGGNYYLNPYLDQQAGYVKSRGKRLGLYHLASGRDATEEADYFADAISDYLTGTLYFLDFEAISDDGQGNAIFGTDAAPAWIASFINEFAAKTGKVCRVYIQGSALSQLPPAIDEDRQRLWLASWIYSAGSGQSITAYDESVTVGTYGDCLIRQYADCLYLTGYDGRLDADIFFGDTTDWDNLAGEAPTPTPTPTVKKGMPVWMMCGKSYRYIIK